MKKHLLNDFLIELLKVKVKSKAKKRKVGAIIIGKNIIDNQYRVISEGYNYFPKLDGINFEHSCENIRGETYECVIHAEESAIMNMLNNNSNFNFIDLTLFCTYSPCINCARLIVQSGIKNLIYIDQHKINFTEPQIKDGISVLNYLKLSGINVSQFNTIKNGI